MKFVELHFNPQKSQAPDLIFDSFCYEPENALERRFGSLFVVGELKNVFTSNLKFLDNLAVHLKKNYYSSPVKSSPEAALKSCLKKTNEFLEGVAKQGEVSWLGNLNLSVLGLTLHKRDNFLANFTKVGTIKILLIRPQQIIDIGKNLEFSEIEPYPLKIFGNIVSGKLAKDDIVAILTKDVFELFSEQEILKEIAKASPFGDEKKLREILKNKEKEFKKISGICLLCVLTKNDWGKNKESRTSLVFREQAEKFSIEQTFLHFINTFEKLLPKLSLSYFTKISLLAQFKTRIHGLRLRKNIILIILLVLLLFLGFLIFR